MRHLLIIFALLPALASAFSAPQQDAIRSLVEAEPKMQPCLAAHDQACVAKWLNTSTSFKILTATLTGRSGGETLVMTVADLRKPGAQKTIMDWLQAQTAAQPAVKTTATVSVWQRRATRAEKALATGTGTPEAPAIPAWEGKIAPIDLDAIWPLAPMTTH